MSKTILSITACAAVAAFVAPGTAQAQSWSTGFGAPTQGSFASLNLGLGATVGENPNTLNPELWLQTTGSFADMSFTLSGNSVPAFSLSFLGGRTVADQTTVRVSLLGPGSSASGVQFVDVPLRTFDVPLALRTITLTPNNAAAWAPGNYLLQFISGSQQA